jgi:hypothetical protein
MVVRSGFLPVYDSEFMPLSRRFERRFAPFHALVRPPPLPAGAYERSAAQLAGGVAADVLAMAGKHFKAVKSSLDGPLKAEPRSEGAPSAAQRAEAMALAKVAIANGVLIASLSLKPPPDGSRARLSFDTHAHFVVATMETPAAKSEAPPAGGAPASGGAS